VRPEDVHTAAPAEHGATATVEVVEPMGAETLLYLTTGATHFIARTPPTDRSEPGQRVAVTFNPDRLHLFDPASEAAL
jgi:multiple sugar transport system ATP-binding protein